MTIKAHLSSLARLAQENPRLLTMDFSPTMTAVVLIETSQLECLILTKNKNITKKNPA